MQEDEYADDEDNLEMNKGIEGEAERWEEEYYSRRGDLYRTNDSDNPSNSNSIFTHLRFPMLPSLFNSLIKDCLSRSHTIF